MAAEVVLSDERFGKRRNLTLAGQSRASQAKWARHREEKAATPTLAPPFQRLVEVCIEMAERLVPEERGRYRPALYAVLARCLEVVERAAGDPTLQEQLARRCRERRLIVERGGDGALKICRLCFDHDRTRSNMYRYAQVLRRAQEERVAAADFQRVTLERGGLSSFLPVPVRTRLKLELDRSIAIPLGVFCLRLEARADGRFRVLTIKPEPAPSLETEDSPTATSRRPKR